MNALQCCISFRGSPSCIKYLIQKGVAVNFALKNREKTPLLKALQFGNNYDSVNTLIEAGADPWCKTETGTSALEVAFLVSSEHFC